jgi:hypothetical protein
MEKRKNGMKAKRAHPRRRKIAGEKKMCRPKNGFQVMRAISKESAAPANGKLQKENPQSAVHTEKRAAKSKKIPGEKDIELLLPRRPFLL